MDQALFLPGAIRVNHHVPDGAIRALEPHGKVPQRFAPSESIKQLSEDFAVSKEGSDGLVETLGAAAAEQVERRLVDAQDTAPAIQPLDADGGVLKEIRQCVLALAQCRFGLLALSNFHAQQLIDAGQFVGARGYALFQFVVGAAQRHLGLLALGDVEVYAEEARRLTISVAHHGCRGRYPACVAIVHRREAEFRLEIAANQDRVPDLLPQCLAVFPVNQLEKLLVGEFPRYEFHSKQSGLQTVQIRAAGGQIHFPHAHLSAGQRQSQPFFALPQRRFRALPVANVEQSRAELDPMRPSLAAGDADELRYERCAAGRREGQLDRGVRLAVAQSAEVLEVLATVRPLDQRQQRIAQELEPCPAQQPRPRQVDVANAPITVESQAAHRCEVVQVRIPFARRLRLGHGLAQPTPFLSHLLEGQSPAFCRQAHAVIATFGIGTPFHCDLLSSWLAE